MGKYLAIAWPSAGLMPPRFPYAIGFSLRTRRTPRGVGRLSAGPARRKRQQSRPISPRVSIGFRWSRFQPPGRSSPSASPGSSTSRGHPRRLDHRRGSSKARCCTSPRSRSASVTSAYLVGAGGGRVPLQLSDRLATAARSCSLVTLGPLSDRHRRDCAVVGFRQLRAVPRADRHSAGIRQRIRGDQLGHPGAGAGALSLTVPGNLADQRQLLARRGARRARRGGVPEARRAAARLGLARRVRHRRGAAGPQRSCCCAAGSPEKPAPG